MSVLSSPAVSVVGRHNSGKTTLIVKLIGELSGRGYDVGSVKHHHQADFAIDVPGKDSYRHRQAGATETMVAGPGQLACTKTIEGELSCSDIVGMMPGHDLVIAEGFRRDALPAIEVMRAENDADVVAAGLFAQAAALKMPLGNYEGHRLGSEGAHAAQSLEKLPAVSTVALVSDIPEALAAAQFYDLPMFGLDEVASLADFLEERFVRQRLTVVIQAGGESRRMGQSKALVPFAGRPLICRAIERMLPVADELVITTNEAERFGFLESEFPGASIRLVADVHEFRGALPGIHTALQAATHPLVAIVACDMLFASPRLVAAETVALQESGADAVVPVNKHGYEPLHAVYRREACLPVVEELVGVGEKRARALCAHVQVREFSQAEVFAAEPMGGCFVNANTPEDLRMLEERFFEL